MLDTDTKRRIDTARDILVGKVPDPKSQVEQITIALIYKFMDDMDVEAEELGGKRSFFTGEYERYGWAKLMRSGLGGHETLALYSEAITKMTENTALPALFRDIFKNAYLPYRDPETLKSFLKVIDEFTYDHSEKLGDAFEYLLSVLGSQGDAGQFRTPRHIIDFMVEIIRPQKGEVVLDPACGTAGFLISAYKHILRANTDAKGNSTLTPDDKAALAKNFKGYDISPDMVRLSLVNLYLHGFTDPHVFEYDTLTSEERWTEFADVILANPPFMSPKGGIKPHKRFSIQAKRSEVLFVDYMAEHLTPQGRAGIIVPEGIIFQSQTAYKELRKMLVENCLVAVISLPAGVFQPYSGVKTSILIFDKSLAKQADSIGFFKVENDGFGLGAQRRPIEKDDLPQVKAEVEIYLSALGARKEVADLQITRGLVAAKEKIAADGDYNLNGDRYRQAAIVDSSWPFVCVGDLFKKSDSTVLPESLDGPVVYLGLENLMQQTGGIQGEIVTENPADIKSLKNVFRPGHILYGKLRPNLNKVWLADREGICSTDIFVVEPADGRVDPPLFAYLFRSRQFNEAVMGQLKGAQLPRIGWSSFAQLEIPLPPLEVQKEIVAEIECYQKVIDGARAVLDNYRPQIPIDPEWPMQPIKEVAEVASGFGFPLDFQGKADEEIPFLKVSDMNLPGNEVRIQSWNNSVSRAVLKELKGKAYPKGTVIFPKIGAAIATNKKRVLTCDSTYDNNVMGIVPNTERLDPDFLHTYLLAFDLSQWASQSQPPSMRKTTVEAHEIPVPPIAVQQAIVAEIEAEQALVFANRELIDRMEQKIQATLARVWGEPADAEPVSA